MWGPRRQELLQSQSALLQVNQRPWSSKQSVKAVPSTLSTACSVPELMIIYKTKGGLFINLRHSIYKMVEADNWGSLCFSCFFSKCASDPSQDRNTTPELHSPPSLGSQSLLGDGKKTAGLERESEFNWGPLKCKIAPVWQQATTRNRTYLARCLHSHYAFMMFLCQVSVQSLHGTNRGEDLKYIFTVNLKKKVILTKSNSMYLIYNY